MITFKKTNNPTAPTGDGEVKMYVREEDNKVHVIEQGGADRSIEGGSSGNSNPFFRIPVNKIVAADKELPNAPVGMRYIHKLDERIHEMTEEGWVTEPEAPLGAAALIIGEKANQIDGAVYLNTLEGHPIPNPFFGPNNYKRCRFICVLGEDVVIVRVDSGEGESDLLIYEPNEGELDLMDWLGTKNIVTDVLSYGNYMWIATPDNGIVKFEANVPFDFPTHYSKEKGSFTMDGATAFAVQFINNNPKLWVFNSVDAYRQAAVYSDYEDLGDRWNMYVRSGSGYDISTWKVKFTDPGLAEKYYFYWDPGKMQWYCPDMSKSDFPNPPSMSDVTVTGGIVFDCVALENNNWVSKIAMIKTGLGVTDLPVDLVLRNVNYQADEIYLFLEYQVVDGVPTKRSIVKIKGNTVSLFATEAILPANSTSFLATSTDIFVASSTEGVYRIDKATKEVTLFLTEFVQSESYPTRQLAVAETNYDEVDGSVFAVVLDTKKARAKAEDATIVLRYVFDYDLLSKDFVRNPAMEVAYRDALELTGGSSL